MQQESGTFIHLHVHSQNSILDATPSVQALAAAASTQGMKALALTDHGNLFGAIDFYKACRAAGVQPILGCEFYVAPGSRKQKSREAGKRTATHLTLLAKNAEGYRNLCQLSSLGYLEGFYYHPRIDHEILAEHSKGLVCLSGCLSGRLAQEILSGKEEEWRKTLSWYLETFGSDFFLELQRHPMAESHQEEDGFFQESWLLHQYEDYIRKQKQVEGVLKFVSREQGIPLVATNDVHYLKREDWRAQEILLNIQSGEPSELWEKDAFGHRTRKIPNPKRRTYPSHEFYFKTAAEMQQLFSDVPEAVANTLLVAEKCQLSLDFEEKHYPVYWPPGCSRETISEEERPKEVEKFLWKLCQEGIEERYTPERRARVAEVYPGRDPMQLVRERLDYEMSVIAPKGMCDYLLIVWDFIHWAKQRKIPVGPGRGSGAGSIVLYLIGVTDIEPLRFHLFFERFINPERISYPDIDVDICMDRRGEVIAYTLQKYGKDNVAQIITFGTMKAKMAIKDVGRVLDVPLAKVNQISKLVPEDPTMTIEKALEMDAELRGLASGDEEAKRILELAKKLEGSIRNTGIHAAGIIISGDPLTEHIPLCVAKEQEMPVTQYSMKPVEMVGMLKIDFLGLKTLTAIQTCVDAISLITGETIDWVNLPLDDEKTFSLLNQGKTSGVFQLESGGMQELAKQLHLDKFEEIIAVGALYRPGPMDMIPSFISRKHGREPIEYDHPWMEEILAETYGIMVYQEQVMQIASKLANFTLGEGDVLRRAMGKKDKEQMAKQRKKFLEGAKENGIDEETACKIFDKIEKFAAYGFNKSHAAAYGYLSYATAYFKANYPSEWMAALMTCDRDDLGKITKLIRECQSMGIPVLSPDVNEAGGTFLATPAGIRFAISGVKGVGEGVVEAIVEERTKGGVFSSLYSFIQRVDLHKAGKKAIENLVAAGGFDWTGWSRDALRQSIEPMVDAAQVEKKEKEKGVISLFSLIEEKTPLFESPPLVVQPTARTQILLKEKELLGFFLTGHPMDEFASILKQLSCIPLRKTEDFNQDTVFRTAFLIESIQVRFSKNQKKFAILTISDGLVQKELPIWPDLYEEKSHLLQENRLLLSVLLWEKKEEEDRLSCRWLNDLIQADRLMVEECDRAYDLAKNMRQRFGSETASPRRARKEEEKKVMGKKMHIRFNMNTLRMSHLLECKEIFARSSGSSPLLLDFHEEERSVATLRIPAEQGVAPHPGLIQELQKLDSILGIELVSEDL